MRWPSCSFSTLYIEPGSFIDPRACYSTCSGDPCLLILSARTTQQATTGDPLLVGQALYPLSHAPIPVCLFVCLRIVLDSQIF